MSMNLLRARLEDLEDEIYRTGDALVQFQYSEQELLSLVSRKFTDMRFMIDEAKSMLEGDLDEISTTETYTVQKAL
ncbi:hypothetical protein [Thermoactinomyces sp. DSM 45892]|uniref:hypothetical protein n=1 Tax=Thermoactinomyces sp. DSM 45892 TaxID=1882753 RepID=UPI00089B1DC9|nr:hypothetical protein [Thermoactinomyces sp. DSM 45892]SDY71018.1 hypothetical protein SAMN05444416_107143 [Thermoactinomyces sp. DSM 45892]